MVLCHNHLRDAFVEFFYQAHTSVKLEGGSGLTPDLSYSRPADLLVRDWTQSKPAAFDIMVTSPLSSAILAEAGQKLLKPQKEGNMQPTTLNVLSWAGCVPLATVTY